MTEWKTLIFANPKYLLKVKLEKTNQPNQKLSIVPVFWAIWIFSQQNVTF